MAEYEVARRLVNGVWETVVVDETGGGTTPNLFDVLVEGNDAGTNQIKNLQEGSDPGDAATVSQVGSLPTLATVLAEGNTTGGSNIDVANGDIVDASDVAADTVTLAGAGFARSAFSNLVSDLTPATATAEDVANALQDLQNKITASGLMEGS